MHGASKRRKGGGRRCLKSFWRPPPRQGSTANAFTDTTLCSLTTSGNYGFVISHILTSKAHNILNLWVTRDHSVFLIYGYWRRDLGL